LARSGLRGIPANQSLWTGNGQARNEQIGAAFRNRLKTVAGFGFVPDPRPMRNSRNTVVYYLFFASPKAVAEKIITDIFNKYRNRSSLGEDAHT
jgi:hypothetical protein